MSDYACGMLIGAILGLIIGLFSASLLVPQQFHAIKSDAIKNGVGEYNHITGEFQWVKPKD